MYFALHWTTPPGGGGPSEADLLDDLGGFPFTNVAAVDGGLLIGNLLPGQSKAAFLDLEDHLRSTYGPSLTFTLLYIQRANRFLHGGHLDEGRLDDVVYY